MNKKTFIHSIITILVICAFISCDMNEPLTVDYKGMPLTVIASFGSSATSAATRAPGGDQLNEQFNDNWSYHSFNDNDKLGFYSHHGDWKTNEGEGSFVNIPLTYNDKIDERQHQFTNPEVTFSPTHMEAVYMYFPYTEDMTVEIDGKKTSEGAPGLELRQQRKGNDTLRCIDFLTMGSIDATNLNNGVLTGTFVHAFSELIIMRGKGFDNPTDWTITAVLKAPYSHIKIDYQEDPWHSTPTLSYDEAYAKEKGIDCRRWHAWRGENYGITEEDPIGKPAWYVLLPTLAGKPTEVEYIEIYDNEGFLQKVSSLRLMGGNTKKLEAEWRYPMEIVMNELVPTVNPAQIVPWNDNIDITDERTRGIHNETDFGLWRESYISYLGGGDETKLFDYGDVTIDANGKKLWHFYIADDLNFEEFDDKRDDGVIIPELKDILDGVSTTLENHAFRNYAISNLKKTFIGKISGDGALQNVDFDKPDITSTATIPIGSIANTIEGGTVNNCNIAFGTLQGSGPVGMVAGELKTGTIKNCTLSGFILGSETATNASAAKIVGKDPIAPYTLEGNDASDVIWGTNNN